MIRINLIPTKAARKREGAIIQLVVGAVAVVIMLFGCYMLNKRIDRRIDAERAEIASLQSQISELKSVIREVDDYKKKRRDLEAKIQTIKDLNAKRSGPVRFMDEFTKVLPRKAWVTTFREVNKQLTLEGISSDGPTVSDFVESLRDSKYFANVQLIQVTQVEIDGNKRQRFSINCVVDYIPAGAA